MDEFTIELVPTDKITVGEQQIRDIIEDEEVIELAADIQKRGLLQLPGVEKLPSGEYQLLWGARRLAAFRWLKKTTIPCRVYSRGDATVKMVALVENLHRRNLTLQEECDAVNYLHDCEKIPPSEIAIRLSKSREWVMRRIAAPRFPQEIREALFDGAITYVVAEALCEVQDDGARNFALQQTIASRLNLTQVRSMVEALKSAPTLDEAIRAGVNTALSTYSNNLLFTCARCGRARESPDMILVRICADECKTEEKQDANGSRTQI